MECQYEVKNDQLTVRVPAELDHHVARSMQEAIDGRILTYGIRIVVFDFAKTEFMDSSGIGVILGRCRNLSFSGGTVKAIHLTDRRVQKIFAMAGLNTLVEVEE